VRQPGPRQGVGHFLHAGFVYMNRYLFHSGMEKVFFPYFSVKAILVERLTLK
jgi:hypothetical protein